MGLILGFWDTRIAVSDCAQSDSRIPHIPDQSDFVRQWFDWHRGYTIIRKADGTHERRELIGEALAEVELGRLPRTLEELQAPAAHSQPRQHQLRRRLPAASTYPATSDIFINDDGYYPQLIDTQEHVTSTSITASQPTVTPSIDPEDRIFDFSNSPSPATSDTEGHGADPVSARHRLLSNLEHNLDDVRANILELAQRTPQERHASEVSSVTSQINAITRRFTRIRQQNHSRLENASANQTMSSPNPILEDPQVDWNEYYRTSGDVDNFLRSDESLRQHIMRLNREESEARLTILGPDNSSNDRQSQISNLNRITEERRRAEQEQARRERQARVFGTREEIERQGAEYQSPLTSLFARQAATQPGSQDYVTSYNNLVLASEGQPSDHNRVWTSRYGPLRGGRSGGGSTEASNHFASTNYGLSGVYSCLDHRKP